jgi:hypothetical protein
MDRHVSLVALGVVRSHTEKSDRRPSWGALGVTEAADYIDVIANVAATLQSLSHVIDIVRQCMGVLGGSTPKPLSIMQSTSFDFISRCLGG